MQWRSSYQSRFLLRIIFRETGQSIVGTLSLQFLKLRRVDDKLLILKGEGISCQIFFLQSIFFKPALSVAQGYSTTRNVEVPRNCSAVKRLITPTPALMNPLNS